MEIKINGTETCLAPVCSPAVMDGLSPNPVIGWSCPAEGLAEVTAAEFVLFSAVLIYFCCF